MARQVLTLLTDDLDGGDADSTVKFGVDGVTYTIDLSERNAGKLRKALDPFIAASTQVGRGAVDGHRSSRSAAVPAGGGRSFNRAVRAWASQNGYELSARGRIPASVVAAYKNR